MAATSLLTSSPHPPHAMSNRRTPLANVPNAINSPFRHVVPASGKRSRAHAGEAREASDGRPPAKKHIVEIVDEDEENVDPRRRAAITVAVGDNIEEPLAKRSNDQLGPVDRKISAGVGRKSPSMQRTDRSTSTKAGTDNSETIRQWQRHYKRQFPTFVLYFDSVPDDVRSRVVRQTRHLGAREEKFFSKDVTHIVTTRPIPPEVTSTSPGDDGKDKNVAAFAAQLAASEQKQCNAAVTLETSLHRRSQSLVTAVPRDVDAKRPAANSADILCRARTLGIKIWALEKLQRMLKTILETDAGDEALAPDTRRLASVKEAPAKPTKDTDLELLLRNEKINGPADRDMTVAVQDMCSFRGYYLYVHDMDEKTRPVMVRDYPKPPQKDLGKWPQFRLTPAGRCPFVEDPNFSKRLLLRDREAEKECEGQAAVQRKTRAVTALENAFAREEHLPRAASAESATLRRSPRKQAQSVAHRVDQFDGGAAWSAKKRTSAESVPTLFGSAQQSMRGLPRMIGGEPVASGLQPSNVTSAIRSQLISSAAISSTAPMANRRVGDSKEISALKRKVLERGGSQTSNNAIPSSYMNDVRAAINNDNIPPPRAAKRKAQETLGVVYEENEYGEPCRKQRKKTAPRPNKPAERDPKPGYCENCKDKFDDFDEHVQSRKHRKFATAPENWTDLDALLIKLRRPHREVQ